MGCAADRACYRPSAMLCRRPSSARAADFPPRCAADRRLHVPQTAGRGAGNRCLDRWICRLGCDIDRACCRPSATLRRPGKAGETACRTRRRSPATRAADRGRRQRVDRVAAVPWPRLGLCAPKTASHVVHRKLINRFTNFTCAAQPRTSEEYLLLPRMICCG